MPMILPPAIYEKVYDILVEHANALNSEIDKNIFVDAYTKPTLIPNIEYSFIGKLGFGGKFYNNCGRIYINCYKEDETEERINIVNNVNTLLQDVLDKYLETIED